MLGAKGYPAPVDRCPHIVDWLTSHDQSSSPELCTTAADAVDRVVARAEKAKWWAKLSGTMASEWRTQAVEFVQLLRSGKSPRQRRVKPISYSAMKKIVSKKIEGRGAGTLMRMHSAKDHPEYHEYYVGLSYTDAGTAVEMLRCRPVVNLQISLPREADVEAMIVPLKLMLRGWASTITRLEVGVPDPNFHCNILDSCRDELSHLPKLKHIITDQVLLHADHVEALCQNPLLSVIELNRGRHLTGKSLAMISKLQHLRSVGIYDSKITTNQAWKFKDLHPSVGLSINGHRYVYE